MKAQLRTHPKVRYQGARVWPPDWTGGYNGGGQFPRGEEGILVDVDIAKRDFVGPERLELVNEYGGRKFVGMLWLDDPTLVPKLHDILKKHTGSPVHEVAGLEVDL